MKYLLFIFILFTLSIDASAQPPGNRKSFIPLYQPQKVFFLNNQLIICFPAGIATIEENSGTLEVFSVIGGLSEALPSTIAAHDNFIIAGYSNGNIDIIREMRVNNLPALKNANGIQQKKIHHISVIDGKAYMAFHSGISIINIESRTVEATGFIGDNGNQEAVYAVAKWKDSVIAASASGLKSAHIQANIQDYHLWNKVSEKIFYFAAADNNSLWLADSTDIYVYNGERFEKIYSSPGKIHSFFTNEHTILTAEILPNDAFISKIQKADFQVEYIRHQNILQPNHAAIKDNTIWVADQIKGLIKISENRQEIIAFNSPYYSFSDKIFLKENILTGAFNTVDGITGISRYDISSGAWMNYPSSDYPVLNNYGALQMGFLPGTTNIVAGSYTGGLVLFSSSPEDYNHIIHAPAYSRKISGLSNSSDGNLWMVAQNDPPVLYRMDNRNKLFSYTIPFSINQAPHTPVFTDAEGRIWIAVPETGLIVFSDNQTPDNPGDDHWRLLTTGQGNGNLPDKNVLSVTMDLNGLVWIGTANGIGIMTCRGNNIFREGCDLVIPVVRYNNFPDFLFRNEKVNTIAVNAANEKWIGTGNGAWKISEGGEKLLQQFTSERKELLDNNVKGIVIDHTSGDVFFSSDKGLTVYRDVAVSGSLNKKDVLVYPNPVPPDHTGKIYIKGLPPNASFRITDTEGRLVYMGKASGGQAEWTGYAASGKKISTGIYLVLVSTDEKKYNLAAKIVYITK